LTVRTVRAELVQAVLKKLHLRPAMPHAQTFH